MIYYIHLRPSISQGYFQRYYTQSFKSIVWFHSYVFFFFFSFNSLIRDLYRLVYFPAACLLCCVFKLQGRGHASNYVPVTKGETTRLFCHCDVASLIRHRPISLFTIVGVATWHHTGSPDYIRSMQSELGENLQTFTEFLLHLCLSQCALDSCPVLLHATFLSWSPIPMQFSASLKKKLVLSMHKSIPKPISKLWVMNST